MKRVYPQPSGTDHVDAGPSTWDLTRGRLWCVADSLPSSTVVVRGLEGAGEVVVTCAAQEMQDVQLLLAIINYVFKQW